MSSKNDDNPRSDSKSPKMSLGGSLHYSAGSKSLEDGQNVGGKTKTPLTAVKWHSAPSAEREDDRPSPGAGVSPVPAVFKTTATIEVTAGGSGGGWKPLQRQKVLTATPTLEEDEDGGRPVVTFPPDNEGDEATSVVAAGVGGGGACTASAAVSAAERIRKRSVMVRRGYSCQESCATARRQAQVMVNSVAATENRRRWLSADTGNGGGGGGGGNSKSMECLPCPQPSAPSSHHRTSFIMAAPGDRKSLDSGLDDVAAAAAASAAATAEIADRRRGIFASTRTSVPSHLSLALPSSERRLTILSPHTQTPSTPASGVHCPPSDSAWHFCTLSATSSTAVSAHSSAVTTGRNRKKSRPGMVLPRLVLPGSSDLDIFSQ